MVVVNQLSVKMRLLHHIIAWILLLNARHFDFIPEWELMLVAIVQGDSRQSTSYHGQTNIGGDQ